MAGLGFWNKEYEKEKGMSEDDAVSKKSIGNLRRRKASPPIYFQGKLNSLPLPKTKIINSMTPFVPVRDIHHEPFNAKTNQKENQIKKRGLLRINNCW